MNGKISKELLAKAMGDIDDRIIDDAHSAGGSLAPAGNIRSEKRSSFPWKWVTAAAAVLVFIVAGTAVMINIAGTRTMKNGAAYHESDGVPGAVIINSDSKNDAALPQGQSNAQGPENDAPGSLPPSASAPDSFENAAVPANVYYWYDGETYRFAFIPAEEVIADPEGPLGETAARNYTEYALQNSYTADEMLDMLRDESDAARLRGQVAEIMPLGELVGEKLERAYNVGKNVNDPAGKNGREDAQGTVSSDKALNEIIKLLGGESRK